MKTSELEGVKLAEWVARAEGHIIYRQERPNGEANLMHVLTPEDEMGFSQQLGTLGSGPAPYAPHENWAQGGPIVERERMNFATIGTGPKGENGQPPIVAIPQEGRRAMEGPTHLIAAMRAYVASKFGDTVPDETVS